jgi:polyhydroxyalkanoate synthesis regulator phasin
MADLINTAIEDAQRMRDAAQGEDRRRLNQIVAALQHAQSRRAKTFDGAAFGREIVEAVKGYTQREMGALRERVDQLERQLGQRQ